MQNRGDGVKRSKRNVLPPNTKTLHAEDMLLGSILHLIKKYPSPRFRANPYLNIDLTTGKVVLDDEDDRTLDKLEAMLSNKFTDNKIIENETFDDIKDA